MWSSSSSVRKSARAPLPRCSGTRGSSKPTWALHEMTALLELEEVRCGYGPTSVLHGVSLSVPDGGIVSLLGANGAGKTTTLRAITGGVPWPGEIRFAGHSLRHKPTEDIVRGGLPLVREDCGILTELTVDENLLLGEHSRTVRAAARKHH